MIFSLVILKVIFTLLISILIIEGLIVISKSQFDTLKGSRNNLKIKFACNSNKNNK